MRDVDFESILPPITQTRGWFEGEYGAYRTASLYCGFKNCVRQCPGTWQHGWAPSHYNIDLEMVVGTNGRASDQRDYGKFFVGRMDQAVFLRSQGVRYVQEIGLPLVYTSPTTLRRVPNSLLVVPVHSTNDTTHCWDFDEYASAIRKIAHKFSRITVCVHASCVDKGYWTKAFEKVGIGWIVGADYGNANTLPRIRDIFSSFEFMTTNGFGSHIAYAAAFKAKTSLWGPIAKYRMEDMKNDVLAQNSPQTMSTQMEFLSETFLRQKYCEFFTDPWDAPERVEWGRMEIGWENKKSPNELKRIFGWNLKTRLIRGIVGRLKKVTGIGMP